MSRPEPRFIVARWALAVACCLGVVLFTIPGHLGLWRIYPFTQLSSMRMLTALGILVGGLCCLGWAAWRRRGTLVRPSIVTALVSIGCVGLVASLLLRDGALRDEATADDAPDVTVLSFNARDTDAEDIAEAVRETFADAVLLVEAPAEVVEGVAELLGEDTVAHTNAEVVTSRFDAVGIVVHRRLGAYEPVEGPELQLGSLALTGGGHGPAHLTVVHPPPPVQRWAPAPRWSSQLATAVQWCEDVGGIVGGDFNAVADHLGRSGLDECESATDSLGLSARGTWPVRLPGSLGAGIDHQLSRPDRWLPTRAKIVEIGDSDHRAVVVDYRRTGPERDDPDQAETEPAEEQQ